MCLSRWRSGYLSSDCPGLSTGTNLMRTESEIKDMLHRVSDVVDEDSRLEIIVDVLEWVLYRETSDNRVTDYFNKYRRDE